VVSHGHVPFLGLPSHVTISHGHVFFLSSGVAN
jgi:hypothetical protein